MALKNKALKSSLVNKAKENTTVTRGTSKDQQTLKQGVPNEHSRKHLDGDVPVVGVSVGITKNMDNYESLRADVWLTDKVADGEDVISASNVLQEIVSEYV